MTLDFVPVWDIDIRWPEAAPLLQKPLERQSAMTIESVYRDCKSGKFHLWLIPGKVAFITEIQQFPAERICMIVLCGGEGLDEWKVQADEVLTRYARTMGCNALMIVGRLGWSVVMPEYRRTDYVLRKTL